MNYVYIQLLTSHCVSYVRIYVCTRRAMEMGPCNTTPMKTCKSGGPGLVYTVRYVVHFMRECES